MIPTPPYRFSNPRYVNTAYWVTVEGALSMNLREFAFVIDAEEYWRAQEALEAHGMSR